MHCSVSDHSIRCLLSVAAADHAITVWQRQTLIKHLSNHPVQLQTTSGHFLGHYFPPPSSFCPSCRCYFLFLNFSPLPTKLLHSSSIEWTKCINALGRPKYLSTASHCLLKGPNFTPPIATSMLFTFVWPAADHLTLLLSIFVCLLETFCCSVTRQPPDTYAQIIGI